jgi:hypothetical protein
MVVDLDMEDGEREIRELEEAGWRSTIDDQTVVQVVRSADALADFEDASEELLVRALNYYLCMDAFMPSLDARELTHDEIVAAHLQYLRKMYDSYGAERATVRCRHEGCTRGAVPLSVFCRVHHFEQLFGKPSPFTH